MSDQQPIATPLKLQLRRVRQQALPAVIFVFALAGAAWLLSGTIGTGHSTGEVNAMVIRLAAPHDGVILEEGYFPSLFDHVEVKQILFRFDTSAFQEQQDKVLEDLSRVQKQLDDVNKKLEDTKDTAPKATLDELKAQANGLRGDIAQYRTRLDYLKRQISAASISAPVTGRITAIKHQPSEFVKQGQEVVTITPDVGSYIVTYIRPGSTVMPKKDMNVLVRSMTGKNTAVARVQEVGTQIQEIPEHQLTNAKRPEWGIPVRIAMPDPSKLLLYPGELVNVSYKVETR